MGPGNLLTSYWPVFDQLTSPVLVGTSSNNKTYFIDRTSQLLEYTSNVGSFRYNYQS